MALYILTPNPFPGARKLDRDPVHDDPDIRYEMGWHVGDPVPDLGSNRVIMFQADGDELALFLRAMNGNRLRP